MSWKKYFYVDEFQEPTKNPYLTNYPKFEGTFKNIAVENAPLKAQLLIDNKYVCIMLYEYGEDLLKPIYDTTCDITLLDETGNKHYMSGYIKEYGDRIFLHDKHRIPFIRLLRANEKLKIHIVLSNNYSKSKETYLFSILRENFKQEFASL